MTTFENKLVAIINKDIDPGVAMNSLAHACIGFGAQFSSEQLRLDNYVDQDGNIYPNISQMPFIILRGKSNEIRKTLAQAKQENIQYGIFTHTMTGGTYLEQLDNTKKTPETELQYYAAVLFGPWDTVSKITKKLSLYK